MRIVSERSDIVEDGVSAGCWNLHGRWIVLCSVYVSGSPILERTKT
jgi:hypothetical protein